jgi:hypothetical protein
MTSYDLGRKKDPEDKKVLDVAAMPDRQLIALTRRIKGDINKYIEHILEYEKELGIVPGHTREQLMELNYNELKDIRNPLKSKLVKRSKVTKIEPAPLSTVEEGLDAIRHDETDYFDSSDIAFITPMEAYQMFGPEFMNYSEDELFNLGYKLEEGPYPQIDPDKPYKAEIKRAIIKYLLEVTDRYTEAELKKKNLEQLRFLYEYETEELRNVPTYEEVVHKLKLGEK